MRSSTGQPYSDDAKLVLKVSYNIGADTSLLLFGLTQGVNNMGDALVVERKNLTSNYGIPDDQFNFIDGSGGGYTTATNAAVTKMLLDMATKPAFPSFFAALPILGVDGLVPDFQSDPTLAGATGQINAKGGHSIGHGAEGGGVGGYIKTKSGRQLVYELVVNDVAITGLDDVIQVIQDQVQSRLSYGGIINAALRLERDKNRAAAKQSKHPPYRHAAAATALRRRSY